MSQFDNFKYYFKHKGEYTDEYDLAQMFYWHYVKLFGYDYIDECINTLTRLVRSDLKRILTMSMEFEKDCRKMFVEMCEELQISRNIDSIIQLVPFNWLNVSTYIGSAYTDYFGVGNFTFSVALLITFEQYTDVVFDSERIEGQLYLIKRCSQVDENVINAIRERAYRYCRKLYGESIKEEFVNQTVSAKLIPVDNGKFVLSWKYVEFMNGKIFLYHPTEYGKHASHPLIIANPKSRIAMNYIKRYLNKNCNSLIVCSKNGRLTKLCNNSDLLKGVDILNERLIAPIIGAPAISQANEYKRDYAQVA